MTAHKLDEMSRVRIPVPPPGKCSKHVEETHFQLTIAARKEKAAIASFTNDLQFKYSHRKLAFTVSCIGNKKQTKRLGKGHMKIFQ